MLLKQNVGNAISIKNDVTMMFDHVKIMIGAYGKGFISILVENTKKKNDSTYVPKIFEHIILYAYN